MKAITHLPSPALGACELTFLQRSTIDCSSASLQHEAYRTALAALGVNVEAVTWSLHLPDSCFIQDTAFVLPEVAIIARMGVRSRRPETMPILDALSIDRPVALIEPPGTLECGDILPAGRKLLAGISSRTNVQAVEQLRELVRIYGYEVIPVKVRGCLHLSTGCSVLDEKTLLVNAEWIDTGSLKGFATISVSQDEPWAANVVRIGDSVLVEEEAEKTGTILGRMGLKTRAVDISEFRKAEGSLSCLSILIPEPGAGSQSQPG